MPASDFDVQQGDGLRWLSFPVLEAHNFILHGFVVKDENPPRRQDPGRVRRLLPRITSSERELVSLQQVHGDECVILRSTTRLKKRYKGDAILTNRNDVFISVQVADCLPIFLLDERKGVIGLVHAGWKGTLLGISRRIVEEARHSFGCRPGDLIILFGPCIQSCCYEVSENLAVLFDPECVNHSKDGRFALDLSCANRQQFLSCGVKAHRIFAVERCTFCESEMLYSYRREGENSGRMIGFLGIK
jgi:YfiH family protein